MFVEWSRLSKRTKGNPWFRTSNKNFHQCLTHALEFEPAKQLCSFQRQTIHTKELPFNMNLQTGKLEQALRWTSGAGDSGSWTALRGEQASTVAGSRLPRRGSSTPQRCDKRPEPGSCSPPLTGPPPSPWVNTAQQGQDTWIMTQLWLSLYSNSTRFVCDPQQEVCLMSHLTEWNLISHTAMVQC